MGDTGVPSKFMKLSGNNPSWAFFASSNTLMLVQEGYGLIVFSLFTSKTFSGLLKKRSYQNTYNTVVTLLLSEEKFITTSENFENEEHDCFRNSAGTILVAVMFRKIK